MSTAWPEVPLDQLVEFLDSKRRPITEHERKKGDIPYYGANGIQDYVDGFLFDEPLVLLAEDGGHFDDPTRGIAYGITGKSWVNNHAHVLRLKSGVDFRFLVRALERYDARPFLTGSTRAKLTKAGASRMPVPLPPVEEQRRIASVLDNADGLRAKRRTALETLDTLSESIYFTLFGQPSADWPLLPIGALAGDTSNAIRTGPFGSQLLHSEFVEDGIAVLGIDNAVQDRFVWAKPRYISPEKYKQLMRFTVYPGDVLVTIMGTCGRSAIVPSDVPLAINTKHLCCITLDQSQCLPTYLAACFRYDLRLRSQLGARQRGAVMPGLNMGLIKGAELRVPPMRLQNDFEESLIKVENQKHKEQKHAKSLDDLFDSLRNRALAGML
jgi:type I restriction enzyme S subunit